MTGHSIRLERLVDAPVARVWEVLTDVGHADRTLSSVTRVELITDGPYRVGTRWRETRRVLGREATEQLQVTAVEPPTRTVVEADSSGVHYVTEFTLAPAAAGATHLGLTFTAVQSRATLLQKALWRLVGRLGLKVTEKMMTRDLDDIATRAERP